MDSERSPKVEGVPSIELPKTGDIINVYGLYDRPGTEKVPYKVEVVEMLPNYQGKGPHVRVRNPDSSEQDPATGSTIRGSTFEVPLEQWKEWVRLEAETKSE